MSNFFKLNEILSLKDLVDKHKTDMMASGSNGEIVAFVGPTKAGKSTLLNCLLGTKLICQEDEDSNSKFIVKADGEIGPIIGQGDAESETVEPTAYDYLPGTSFIMWDFPGFGDNKGSQQEILNAIAYQKILCAQKSVRFVLVMPAHMLTDSDPSSFYKLLNSLLQFGSKVGDSVCIVFTKSEKGINIQKLLEKKASILFPHAQRTNAKLIKKGNKIIKKVLENNAFINFQAPKTEPDEEFIMPNQQKLIDCVRNLNGTKVANVPLVISPEAKLEIAELFTIAYEFLRNKVNAVCLSIEQCAENCVRECEQLNEIGETAASVLNKIAVFERKKMILDGIRRSSEDIESLLCELKRSNVKIDEDFTDNIQIFQFIEELKSLYKLNEDEKSPKGALQFFKTMQLALCNAAGRYSAAINYLMVMALEEKRKELELELKVRQERRHEASKLKLEVGQEQQEDLNNADEKIVEIEERQKALSGSEEKVKGPTQLKFAAEEKKDHDLAEEKTRVLAELKVRLRELQRKELEWQEDNNFDSNNLESEVNKLNEDNETLLVKIGKAIVAGIGLAFKILTLAAIEKMNSL